MSSTRDLRLQVVLQTIDKATSVLRKVKGDSSGAAKALKETRDSLKRLNEQQREIGRFQDLQAGLQGTEQKLQAAKDRVQQLSQALHQAGPPSKAMIGQLKQAQVAAKVLGQQHEREGVQLDALRGKLSAAGIATGNLAATSRLLRADQDRLNTSLRTQTQHLEAVAARQKKIADLNAQNAAWAKRAGIAAAAGYAMQAGGTAAVRRTMAPVGSFKRHEDAMLGIARQVPGARAPDGNLTAVYRAIQQQVRELSHEVPLATTQIAEMFTAAARMEVPVDQLKEFTRTASMMATAFDAIPDEVTEAMGKVAKNFKIPITQITGLADSINYLDDNAISKGADIIDYLNRVSGVASTVAMSAKDAAALGSTLLTLGERTETAGTATNAMLTKFAAATKGTKKFRLALSEIGIGAEDLEKGMSTNATGTLLQVIEAIRKLPKDKQLGVMAELVGLEHSDTLAKLADKAEELRRQLQLANGTEGAGSMAREAAARNATLSAQQQMFENRIFNLSAVMGESLKPALLELLQIVNPLLERITTWAQENPRLVSGLMQTAIVLGAIVAAAGAILLPLALIAGKVILARFLFASLFGGTTLAMIGRFTGAIMGLGRGLMFLMLNPIGLVVTAVIAAVAAIVAAGYLIYKNWDAIVAWLGRLGSRFTQIGSDLIKGLVSGITGALGWVKTAVGQVADNTIGWFKEKLGIRSPSRVFMAAGVNVSQGAALGITRGHGLVRRAAAGLTAAVAAAPMLASTPPLRLDTRPPLGAQSAAAPAGAPRGGDHFHLHLAPGMDPQAIARAVSAELDRRDRAKAAQRRSSLSDND